MCPAILGVLQGLLLPQSPPDIEFPSSRKAMARPSCHAGIQDFDTGWEWGNLGRTGKTNRTQYLP